MTNVWGQERYSTQISAHLEQCLAGNEVHYQAWFEFAGLGLRYFDVAYYPYHGDEGTVTHAVVVSRDVTDHKLAEEALQKAHAQNERLLTSISSILIGVGPDERVTHWNTPAKNAFGIPAANALGRPIAECGIQWDWPNISEHIAHCRQSNQPLHLTDIRYAWPNGKERFLNISINPFVGDKPSPSGFLLLAEDITERKSLEMQLAQAQKQQAIGQLAAGVAHEINTPIQYVNDNTHFLQKAYSQVHDLFQKFQVLLQVAKTGSNDPGLIEEIEHTIKETDVEYLLEEIPVAIQQSQEGITRVIETVRAMREFSHPGTGAKTAIDINKAIENTLAIARSEWKYVANVETNLDASLPLVPCLPSDLNQTILNIIVNAAHAVAEAVGTGPAAKGTIAISTRRDGDWVEIRISDTGPGIPQEIQPRIFELFFTTKEVGKGTGQGLSIAHNIVEKKHGGKLTFETKMGEGTTFIIRLPIHPISNEEATNAQKDPVCR